jgi:hypothetical protein
MVCLKCDIMHSVRPAVFRCWFWRFLGTADPGTNNARKEQQANPGDESTQRHKRTEKPYRTNEKNIAWFRGLRG